MFVHQSKKKKKRFRLQRNYCVFAGLSLNNKKDKFLLVTIDLLKF